MPLQGILDAPSIHRVHRDQQKRGRSRRRAAFLDARARTRRPINQDSSEERDAQEKARSVLAVKSPALGGTRQRAAMKPECLFHFAGRQREQNRFHQSQVPVFPVRTWQSRAVRRAKGDSREGGDKASSPENFERWGETCPWVRRRTEYDTCDRKMPLLVQADHTNHKYVRHRASRVMLSSNLSRPD